MARFNACVSITPATPIFLEKQHFNLIRVENNINYREVMMSLIYFDSYVKYDYERFLAKALKDTKPTPNQGAEIKEILSLTKQEKKNWFIARFLQPGIRHLQKLESHWIIKKDAILQKAGMWRNLIYLYISDTEGNDSGIEREKQMLLSALMEMSK